MNDDQTPILRNWREEIDAAVAASCESAIDTLGRLPVFDATIQRILGVLDDPDASNEQLVAAMESDATYAANLLRYANSAGSSHRIRARSIRQAVMFVGREALRRLTIETATFRFFERIQGSGSAAAGQLHLHALAVALAASNAAEQGGSDADQAHLAGLLHDIGKLVLPNAFGAQAIDAIVAEAPNGLARVALERERLGIDHAQVGALLAERWGTDEHIVEAVAWHHGGSDGAYCPSPEVACVQLANVIAAMLSNGAADPGLLSDALERCGLQTESLDQVATQAASASAVLTDSGTSQRIAQLERLAQVDDLTGIANRRCWNQEVRGKLDAGAPGTLVLIDIDHFKQINDTFGHQAGDRALAEVAGLLATVGYAGRLGGDEFAVWMTDAPPVAQAKIDGLLVQVAGLVVGDEQRSGPVGISVGMAGSGPGRTTLDDLVACADDALYAAKDAGRGRAVLFGSAAGTDSAAA